MEGRIPATALQKTAELRMTAALSFSASQARRARPPPSLSEAEKSRCPKIARHQGKYGRSDQISPLFRKILRVGDQSRPLRPSGRAGVKKRKFTGVRTPKRR